MKTIFVSWAPKDAGEYLDAAKWQTEPIPASAGLMQWMFCIPMQVDGKNGVDLVAGGAADMIAGVVGTTAQIGWFESPANPRALADFKWHSLSPAAWVMSLILSDMDGDDDLDVVTSDRTGAVRGCRWLENPGPGRAQYQQWISHFIGAVNVTVGFMKIGDLDKDGLEDVVVAAKPRSILYLKRLDTTGLSWQEYEILLPEGAGAAKAVAVGDIDNDGKQDIVFSCEGANEGKSGVMWISYKDNVLDGEWICHDISGPLGSKFDRLELLDLDGDSDLDVLTTEEREHRSGLGVIWYENPHEEPALTSREIGSEDRAQNAGRH
ncbi:MAG: VCBS repeat-containing protein [Phycisphaerales bacterium]|nr:MAG: VCBS repeat-containing protein [Phycisphaerales bacterium]